MREEIKRKMESAGEVFTAYLGDEAQLVHVVTSW
jgi:hypothetical protein